MTDERIKEEFDTWISDIECTDNEMRFFNQYPSIDQPTAVGFYAGFRTSERLAKIEALEALKSDIQKEFPHYDRFLQGRGHENEIICGTIEKLIAELEEEGE